MSDGAKDFWEQQAQERLSRVAEAERKRKLRPTIEEAMAVLIEVEFGGADFYDGAHCPYCGAYKWSKDEIEHDDDCELKRLIDRWEESQ